LLYCPFNKKHIVSSVLEQAGGQIVQFGFDLKGVQTWQAHSSSQLVYRTNVSYKQSIAL
jgi:D-glycero-alpha-D-manno-heptose-7-phosphate kinase